MVHGLGLTSYIHNFILIWNIPTNPSPKYSIFVKSDLIDWGMHLTKLGVGAQIRLTGFVQILK